MNLAKKSVGRDSGARNLHGIVLHSYRRAGGEWLWQRILSDFDCEGLRVSDFTLAMRIQNGPGRALARLLRYVRCGIL